MIAIIDYGAGNTRSVMNALDRLNTEYILTDNREMILRADKVVFPGVGHAKHAMSVLTSKGLDETIKQVEKPLLGICVGMQLLFDFSEEGSTKCLGIVEGTVKKFDEADLIVPQMGWNRIQHDSNDLFLGLESDPWFYSVHSYYAEVGKYTISTSRYGKEYTSTLQKDNFFGTQYHPEKSSTNGKLLLQNFLEL